jgi:hypothetical protein
MLFPLFIIGAGALLGFLAGTGSSTSGGGSHALPTPASTTAVSGRPSRHGAHPLSAVVTLIEFGRRGQQPPPQLILAALREAERAGAQPLVRAIVEKWIRPVVEAAAVAPPPPPPQAWAYGTMPPPMAAPTSYACPPPYPSQPPYPQPAPPSSPGGYPPPSPPASGPYAPPDAGGPPPGDPPGAPPSPGSMSDADILRMVDPSLPPATTPAPSPDASSAGTITVSGRSSPIEGVGTPEWSRFCDRMSRELPTYTSPHHVGQFRQHRLRLMELGIDPETVVAYPDYQRHAFDADMAQTYARAHAAGLLGFVGHPVEVPTPDGPPQVAQVTTSGVLGVVQAAGVEGAASWLQSPEDRRKFAGTTGVFCRANGVF